MKFQRHKNMEYIAIAKNIKITPRKMRLVVDGVKKQNIKAALASLAVMNKRAAVPIKKAVDSAIANAVNNFKADKDSLKIKDIMVTEGATLKRFHFAGRGRTRPYTRRSSQIRVVLMDENSQTKTVKTEEGIKNENKTKALSSGKEKAK